MAFETDMQACAADYDRRAMADQALEREEQRLMAETLAQAKAGNYDRLLDAMDYRDNDQKVMRALVLCAAKGNVEAVQAINALARTYGELHAEVDK